MLGKREPSDFEELEADPKEQAALLRDPVN